MSRINPHFGIDFHPNYRLNDILRNNEETVASIIRPTLTTSTDISHVPVLLAVSAGNKEYAETYLNEARCPQITYNTKNIRSVLSTLGEGNNTIVIMDKHTLPLLRRYVSPKRMIEIFEDSKKTFQPTHTYNKQMLQISSPKPYKPYKPYANGTIAQTDFRGSDGLKKFKQVILARYNDLVTIPWYKAKSKCKI